MKAIFITIISVLLVIQAKSQYVSSIGIKGGMSIANQTWHEIGYFDRTIVKEYRHGLYAAATVDLYKSKYFNLTTDIGYCQKGSKDSIYVPPLGEMPIPGHYEIFITKFNYFLFNPMLKVKYETKHWIPYILLGLRCDYQLSNKTDFLIDDLSRNFQRTIWGVTAGAGIEYKISRIGINTELQYHHDFTQITYSSMFLFNSFYDIKNKAYIVSLGVKYYLHK